MPLDLHLFLVLLHIAGTILGVGGATQAEIFYWIALKDGKINPDEKLLMHANYTVIRIGTLLILLSGVALVWWWVYAGGSDWPLGSAKIWAKDVMILVIVVNAVLLTRKLIPLWLGASLSLTSWWGATVLGVWERIPYSFIEIMIGYVMAIALVAVLLEFIKHSIVKIKHYH